MAENKDLTARDLQRKFLSEMGINFSIPTIKFHRRQMKWSMKRKRYCQLISYKNKHVLMNWCMDMLNSSDTFSDVIFVDESNVELSSTSRLSFYKIDVSMDRIPRRAAKPKHSYTVIFCFSFYVCRVTGHFD